MVSPARHDAGDFDIAIDDRDGRAYYCFERVHSELVPPFVREAPAHFVRDGLHYLITSGTTWYFPNPSEVAVASDFHGPWTVLGDPHPTDPSRTSFRSQISCVFRHPGFEDRYIAMADRWLPHVPAERSNVNDVFARLYRGESIEHIAGDELASVSDPTPRSLSTSGSLFGSTATCRSSTGATSGGSTVTETEDLEQWADLAAAVDAVIPADDWPVAS